MNRIYIGPIGLTSTDITMFVLIFLMIAVAIGAYFLDAYIKRKKYKKYDEERMRIFQERLAKINDNQNK